MKRNLKSSVLLLTVLAMLVLFCLAVGADESETITASGTYGTSNPLTWVLTSDGTLTISGEGDMSDYGQPWENYYSTIEKVVIQNGVTSIGNSAFESCTSLTSIIIPNSVTSIGDHAFYYCTSLTSITIPNSVTSIGGCAFCDCKSLASVTIGNSVTIIGSEAFSRCKSLTSIIIPDSVTSIDSYAFSECTSLTSITIGNGLTTLGEEGVFDGCSLLAEINVDVNNQFYKSDSGVLFSKDGKTLVCYPVSRTESTYTIPYGVTSIDNYAFVNCASLTSVIIPDSVTSIGYAAFYNCSALVSIILPDSITTFEMSSFRNCDALTTVKLPNGITEIPSYMFANCDSLAVITIPDSVTRISFYAFGWSPALETVYYTGSPLNWNQISIENGNTYLTNAELVFIHEDGTSHELTAHVGKDPTCNEVGWAEYVTCSKCDYSTYEEIPVQHDEISHAGKAPTCTEGGWAEYVTCSKCEYSTYEALPAKGHIVSVITTTNDANYPFELVDGVYSSTNTDDYSISVFTVTAISATKLTVTYAVSSEDYYDELIIEKNGLRIVTASGEVSWTEIEIELGAGDIVTITYSKDISSSSGFDTVWFSLSESESNSEPTCTESVKCVICQEIFKEALGHDKVIHSEKAVSCTESGWAEYITCSRCDYSTYEEIPAIGHSYVDNVCSNCGYIKNGLIHEDGGYRFYVNGVAQYGWVDTDGDGEGDSYFYVSSQLRCEEDRVLFDGVDARRFFKYNSENGHMEIVNGFYTNEKGTQYFIDGLGAYGWITSDGVSITDRPGITLEGCHYFAYGDGLNFYMVEDSTKTIGGVVREFDENHLVKSYTGWATNKKTGNANYYVAGVLQQGWCLTPDGWVYLSRSENLVNNITYGDVFYGWRKIGGKTYYFRASTSNPAYVIISDPVRQLTYNGVRGTYYVNQKASTGTGADYYITNPPGSTPTVCTHEYKLTFVKDATCTAKGCKTYTCSKCSNSYNEEVNVIAHDYAEATCTAPKTCKACGATVGSAKSHNYVNDVCTGCNHLRPLYSGLTFMNYCFPDNFCTPNPDGSVNYELILDECKYMDFSESTFYWDEENQCEYEVVPENVFIEAVLTMFALSDSQIQEFINASPYKIPWYWDEDWCSYYEDGYFYLIETPGEGGVEDAYSYAIVGYTSRPGELITYIECSRINYEYPPNGEFGYIVGYEHKYYYTVTYKCTENAEWVIYADHNLYSIIASYDKSAVESLRVKSVELIDSLPADIIPAIQSTKTETWYQYYKFDDGYSLYVTIYEEDPSVIHISVEGIDCCRNFHKEGENFICDCGNIVFTNEDLYDIYSKYTFNREFE